MANYAMTSSYKPTLNTSFLPPPQPPLSAAATSTTSFTPERRHRKPSAATFAATFASKTGGLGSIFKSCGTCGGKGAVECSGCKGTGKNKKNGNIFERWKCFECQGFGLKGCPQCGKGGLTPEQRGER